MSGPHLTHALCYSCWDLRQPGRIPVRVVEGPAEVCCGCDHVTISGIYVRADPATFRCSLRLGAHA